MKLEPPPHLADIARKLCLQYNGMMGEDTYLSSHVFTCSLPPLVGASLDVPEDATAGELEEAYIAKRNQFSARVVTLTEDEANLVRFVFEQRLPTYADLAAASGIEDGARWKAKAALSQSILNKLAK